MFTTCADAFKEAIILRRDTDYVTTYTSVIRRIENTMHFRHKQLNDGLIEAGENIDIDELEIFSQQEDLFIIPKQEKKQKVASTYNDYITFIDTE